MTEKCHINVGHLPCKVVRMKGKEAPSFVHNLSDTVAFVAARR